MDVEGAVNVKGGELVTEVLQIKNDGVGNVDIGPIKAKTMIVSINGASQQEFSGGVTEG